MEWGTTLHAPVRGLGMGLSGVGGASSGTENCLCGGLFFFMGTGGGTTSGPATCCGERERDKMDSNSVRGSLQLV